MTCEIKPEALADRLCALCNQPGSAHAAAPDIPVALPARVWRAVLEAMAWDLPATAYEASARANLSERCFIAQRAIRAALAVTP